MKTTHQGCAGRQRASVGSVAETHARSVTRKACQLRQRRRRLRAARSNLGYMCQDYHGEAYADEGLAGADLAALNIPDEDELVTEYCKHAGRDRIDNWTFYIVYNMFRSAGIVQGVYKRGLDGNASSAKAVQYKEAARRRAEQAWQLLQERGLV